MAYTSNITVNETDTSEPGGGAVSGDGGSLIDIVAGYSSNVGVSNTGNGDTPEATFLDIDGFPLPGTLTIFRGSEAVLQGEVRGKSVIPGPVPVGVTSGSNVEEGESYNLVFEPSITGVNYVQEDYINNPTGTIQYGRLQGKVEDVDGAPVPEDSVEATGAVALTDGNGNYEIVGPGGTETTILAAGNAEAVEIAAGNTTTVDFVYSRLIVRVLAPDKSPVRGAKVSINGKSFETDQNGKATIDLAGTKDYNIELGEFQTQETISQSGEEVRVTIGDTSSGIKITAAESDTGRNIGSTTVQIGGSGVIARTSPNGEASSIGESEGETPVLVGAGDKRYVKEQLVVDLTRGEMVRGEVELDRKSNTPTL